MSPRLRDLAVIVAFGVAVLVTLLQPVLGRDRVDAAKIVDVVSRAITDGRLRVAPGDTVIVHPPWRDDIVATLLDRRVLPDGVAVTEAFTRRHGSPWPAVVVVAEGVHAWPRSLEARRRDLGVDVVVDGDVQLFRLPADATPEGGGNVVDVARAAVHVDTSDGRRVPCPWDDTRRRHVCRGLGPWMTVGGDTLTIGGRQEHCTWSHPISGGRLVIDHGLVDLSSGLTLQAALSDAAADNSEGAAVTYILRVDDAERTVTVHRGRGFSRLDVAPRPGKAQIELIVATAHDGQRHTCHRLNQGQR